MSRYCHEFVGECGQVSRLWGLGAAGARHTRQAKALRAVQEQKGIPEKKDTPQTKEAAPEEMPQLRRPDKTAGGVLFGLLYMDWQAAQLS